MLKRGFKLTGMRWRMSKNTRTRCLCQLGRMPPVGFFFSRRTVLRKPPPDLQLGEKPLVLVMHDESTFNANDGKRRLWMKENEQPLRPKGKEKGIMVYAFLTPGGILKVPIHVSNGQLLADPIGHETTRENQLGRQSNTWSTVKTTTGPEKNEPYTRWKASPPSKGLESQSGLITTHGFWSRSSS